MKNKVLILTTSLILSSWAFGGQQSGGGSGGAASGLIAKDFQSALDMEAITKTELHKILELKGTSNDPVFFDTGVRSLVIEGLPQETLTTSNPLLEARDLGTDKRVLLIVE